jgi:3-hydroxyisobutyrate dehydrogenase-like beta-hydroxyacid dehydrogenase
MQVGFIGLGRMGQGIAGNIQKGDHDLVVYNRTRSKAADLEKNGAKVADSIGAACAGRDVVFSMLADDNALREVLANGMLEQLPKGAIHVPMGTHSVEVLAEIDAKHKAAGQILVACPVLGRPDAAAAATLGLVPAGPPEAVAKLKPIWDVIGRRAFNGGTNPAGAAAVKLANNMVLGCAIEAMAEGFALTRKFGVEPADFCEVMTDGLFASPSYKAYGAIMVNESYDKVGFTTKLGLKDTKLMLAAGESAHVPLPSLNVYRDSLLDAMAHDEGDLDWAVIARVRARASGIE